jgi:toxin ParE1/3/4
MAYRVAPEAAADLDDIWEFVASRSSSLETADRLIDTVIERFLLLARFPGIGRRRDDLRSGLRSLPVGQYLVFYRLEGDDVLILRVLHGARDVEALFRQ